MGVKFKMKLTPRTVQLLKGKSVIDQKVVAGALEVMAGEIVARTQNQQGIEAPLPGLSLGYSKYKAAVGRNPVPDRTLTGDLLKAIHSKITNSSQTTVEGKIYFQDGPHRLAPKAKSGKRKSSGQRARTTISEVARAMQKLAPFFGLSAKQRAALVELIRKTILGKI